MISFGLCSTRKPRNFFHVDAVVVAANAIRHRLEPFARHVDRRAVREMTAGGQIESHESVAWLQQREEDFRVGRRTRMRLHVRELAAEQFRDALDRQPLGNVHVLAAAVVAFARQALGIFVGEDRALRFQHRARDDVLGGDQLDLVALAARALSRSHRRSRGRPRPSGAENRASISPAGLGARRRRHHDLLAPRAIGADQ